MNKKIKLLIIACTILLLSLVIVACGSDTYKKYDSEGYNVTVKYDANGSYFSNAGQLYVTDSYNISDLKVNANGMKEILLVDPEDPIREKENVQEVARAAMPGYFFAGWYTEMAEAVDENGNVLKDDKGNTVYNYSGKWDFSKKLEIDPNKEYTASEPVVTLYAAWVRNPAVEIYDGDTLIGTYEIKNPTLGSNSVITAPYLDLKKGEYNFGTLKSAYTWQEREVIEGENGAITSFFKGLYLDKDLKTPMGEKYTHPYVYDEATATISNLTLRVWVGYEEKAGEWYKIYSSAQLANNASASGNYEILADLEFTALTAWPNTFRNNDFTGTIVGNGHKISGISLESNTGSATLGMFKSISKDAKIENVNFENVSALIDRIYIKPGARYAVVAASIEDGFKFKGVTFTNATLKITTSAFNLHQDSIIGLVCAEGYSDALGISLDGFATEAVTTEYDIYDIEIDVDVNKVTLAFPEKGNS